MDGQLLGTVRAAREVPGARVGDVQLRAQLVEAALLRDVVEQGEVEVGHRVSGGLEALLPGRQHARMAVVAAEHEQHALRVRGAHLGGHALEGVVEAFRVMDVRLQAIVGEAAGREHLDVVRGQHDGVLDAVRAVQLAHVAVSQDVAAHHDGLQTARHVGGGGDTGVLRGHVVSLHVLLDRSLSHILIDRRLDTENPSFCQKTAGLAIDALVSAGFQGCVFPFNLVAEKATEDSAFRNCQTVHFLAETPARCVKRSCTREVRRPVHGWPFEQLVGQRILLAGFVETIRGGGGCRII